MLPLAVKVVHCAASWNKVKKLQLFLFTVAAKTNPMLSYFGINMDGKELILLLQMHPALFRKNQKDFRDLNKGNDAWKSISADLNIR